MPSQNLRAFEFQKIPSALAPVIVSYLARKDVCSFSLTNKSNAILSMGQKRDLQMVQQRKRMKKAKNAFAEKYGYPVLGRACYTLVSSTSENEAWYEGVLSDIKGVLESTPVDQRMYGFIEPKLVYLNGLTPFEMVLHWAFVNRNAKPSTYTDEMVERVLSLLVEPEGSDSKCSPLAMIRKIRLDLLARQSASTLGLN